MQIQSFQAPLRLTRSFQPGSPVGSKNFDLGQDRLTLGHGSKMPAYGGLSLAGAVGGGYAVHSLTSSLTGTSSAVVGSLAGAVVVGLAGAITVGVIMGRKPGFEGLAAAQGGAIVGGVAGLIGGAVLGARLGAGSLLTTGAGVAAGAIAGLVFANGLTK